MGFEQGEPQASGARGSHGDDGTGADSVRAAQRLDDIPALMDEAFRHMEVEDFLDALLERVTKVLGVDTAVVLLVDRQGQTLEAMAAKGLEEEVSQGVHVPLGRGFAGRVAVERRPFQVEDVPTFGVFNPLLVQRGLRSLLGVPMIAYGSLVGVLHVGSLTPRTFTPQEIEMLQLAGARAATAVQSSLAHADHAAALELQKSLIPAALPEISGLELAARYRPGSAIVGGDWYDVFCLPTGHVGIVMGDVAGHGLTAAVVMGRMRSALRAYALESTDPAEVLRKLDRKIQHFEAPATATVLYVVAEPSLERLHLSCAGHLPPVFAMPGEAAHPLQIPHDLLIGVADVPRHVTTIDFPPGALLALYTDGLVERRDNLVEDAVARLCKIAYPGPPEAVTAAIMAGLIGRERPMDDVALLLIRRDSRPDQCT
jgi:putative methionine-R-sulfoxide reductase with GAF domain